MRRRGRPPKLDPSALPGFDADLARSPREAGFDLDRWSLAAIAALIERRTGTRYHRRHVGRVVRRMGWIVPPYGAAAAHAFRHRRVRDPDGNPLALLARSSPAQDPAEKGGLNR